jgi:hypothetical protein
MNLDSGRAGTPCAHTVAPQVPVLGELTDDLGLDPTRVLLVDHHGERAGKTSPPLYTRSSLYSDCQQSAGLAGTSWWRPMTAGISRR